MSGPPPLPPPVTKNMKRTEKRAPMVRTDRISPVSREELDISEAGLSERAGSHEK